MIIRLIKIWFYFLFIAISFINKLWIIDSQNELLNSNNEPQERQPLLLNKNDNRIKIDKNNSWWLLSIEKRIKYFYEKTLIFCFLQIFTNIIKSQTFSNEYSNYSQWSSNLIIFAWVFYYFIYF